MHREYGHEGHHGYGPCCCRSGHHGHGHFQRRFLTREEKIEKLEEYAKELKNELAAVQDHIKELKVRTK